METLKIFIKYLLVGLLFVLLLSDSSGAEEISIRAFLATAAHDTLLHHQNEKIDFLAGTSSNTPFFERIELRSETDEFMISQQSYSLRLYPNGFGATKAGRKLYDATLQNAELERELLLHQALKKRYLLIISLSGNRQLLPLKEKLVDLYADRIRILKQRVNNLDFDVNDLITAEQRHTRLQMDVVELKNSVQNIEDEMRIVYPEKGAIDFDTGNMAGIKGISETIENTPKEVAQDNIYVRNSSARMQVAGSRHDLGKAENRKLVRFFEASYDSDKRRQNSGEVFSLQVGIRLPFINSDRLDVNRRKLDFLTEKGRCEELNSLLRKNIRLFSANLKGLLAKFDILAAKKESGSSESSLKVFMRIEGGDPLVLIDLRESILERDLDMVTIKAEIYSNYIELLDVSGKISEQPLKNYISAGLEPLMP